MGLARSLYYYQQKATQLPHELTQARRVLGVLKTAIEATPACTSTVGISDLRSRS